MLLNPGDRLDRFVIVERLGAGGMGAVYVGEDPTTGIRRAIKTLERNAEPELLLRFQREGRAMAAVDRHPNIVAVHLCGEAGGLHYLAMELAGGGDLQARLADGPLPPREAAALVAALSRGLAHAHAQGVLHRDLKPANVVFDDDGVPKLTDFGLAKVHGTETLTGTGTAMGTPAYMAPEQALGEGHDERTDVYGMGAVLYQCLTGRPPFLGKGLLAVLIGVSEGRFPPPSEIAGGIPAELEAVCLRAMAKAPADRFASAAALADALEACASGPSAASARSARGALSILGGLLLLGLIAFGGVWVVLGGATAPTASKPTSSTTPTPPTPASTSVAELLKKGREAEWRGEFVRARAILERGLLAHPDSGELAHQLSEVLRRSCAYDEALVAIDRALRIDPSSLRWRASRALTLAGLERLDAAAAEVEAVLGTDPTNRWGLMAKAVVRFARGDFVGSRRLVEQILVIDSDDVAALAILGVSIIRAKPPNLLSPADLERARTCLDRAVRLRPNYTNARVVRAMISFHLRQSERALEDLNHVLRLRRDVAALRLRASVYLSRGEYTAALADCEEFARLRRRPATAGLTIHGGVLTRLGRHREAAPILRESLRGDPSPGNHQALLFLATALIRGSIDLRRGIRVIESYLKLRPDHADAYVVRAEGHLGLNRLDPARRDLERARALIGRDRNPIQAEISDLQRRIEAKQRH